MQRQRSLRRFAGFFVALTVGFAAAPALTQSGPTDIPNSAAQLRLPEQFTIFGDQDPNVRKPTAIVNGDIITRTDVDHRLALVIASNPGATISDEERNRLRMQVLRNLIDEMLQIQEAEANEISITATDVASAYTEVAQRQNTTPNEFAEFLRSRGSSERSIQRQIQSELAWSRLLRRYVNPFVNVSDAEVQDIIDRLEASRGQTEYRVAEIFVSARPDNQQEVLANLNQILGQISQGASFPAYARQYSESPTAAVGGDLGWVRPEQLPPELAAAISQLPVGGLSRPIPLAGGFSVIAVADSRQILTSDPRDATLSLKQISILFPPGTPQNVAEPRVAALASRTQAGGGCGGADAIAAELGAEIVQNDGVRLRDLPAALQQAMVDMQVGQATPPFGSLEQGVRVLVMCGRDDPPATAEPDAEAIMAQMENTRVNRQAQRYLRDLRRDAVIEYR